jgi:hypothetical protein
MAQVKAFKPCGFHGGRALLKSLCPLIYALLAACASSKPPSPGNDHYMVSALRTPFYRYGPAQGIGADGVLENGTHLTLLYKSYGFSRVMLTSGISGYVSTDGIAPAPPEPKRATTPAPSTARSRKHSNEDSPPPPPMDQPLGLPELPSDPLPGFRY